jgi:trk system potassium uptake protein TrkA
MPEQPHAETLPCPIETLPLPDIYTALGTQPFKLRKGQYALVEEQVHPQAPAGGRALRDLALPSECAVAAIIRSGQLLVPRPDLVLQPADEVLAVVHASQVAHLADLLGCPA